MVLVNIKVAPLRSTVLCFDDVLVVIGVVGSALAKGEVDLEVDSPGRREVALMVMMPGPLPGENVPLPETSPGWCQCVEDGGGSNGDIAGDRAVDDKYQDRPAVAPYRCWRGEGEGAGPVLVRPPLPLPITPETVMCRVGVEGHLVVAVAWRPEGQWAGRCGGLNVPPPAPLMVIRRLSRRRRGVRQSRASGTA